MSITYYRDQFCDGLLTLTAFVSYMKIQFQSLVELGVRIHMCHVCKSEIKSFKFERWTS